MTGVAKRVILEVAGWALLLLGIAALFLPGPGLLAIFGGLYLLSQRYDWAERRVEPVKLRALLGAADGVETWFRIFLSMLGILGLVGFGLLWVIRPDVPNWWPLGDRLWLPGGVWPAVTLFGSAAIAFAMIVYSFRRFHGKPEAVAELRELIEAADDSAFHRKGEGGEGTPGS